MRWLKRNKRGQVSLELSVAIACALILLFAAFKIMLWFGARFSSRQFIFETTRVIAGTVGAYAGVAHVEISENELIHPPLRLFTLDRN